MLLSDICLVAESVHLKDYNNHKQPGFSISREC